jgi:hypothetical protein
MKKNLKSALIAAVLVACFAAGMVGGTYSYFTDTGKTTTAASVPSQATSIVEPGDMTLETKNAAIRNTGNENCYVRVRMDVNFEYLKDYVSISTELNDGWTLKADGYYYYGTVLAPGEQTPNLFKTGALTLKQPSSSMTEEEQKALEAKLTGMKVLFTQESVQSVLYGADTSTSPAGDITDMDAVWAYVDAMNNA